jgi:hypothetical protein
MWPNLFRMEFLDAVPFQCLDRCPHAAGSRGCVFALHLPSDCHEIIRGRNWS